MNMDEAISKNPYYKERGKVSAYIRYIRYNVEGYFEKRSEEVRKELEKKGIKEN